MTKSIKEIEGIGPAYAERLVQAGLATTGRLLEAGATKKGRQAISRQSGISEKLILNWVNMCDLFRISGVAGQFAELLEASGVDSVKELRHRNAENLAAKMKEVNEQKHLCKVSPGVTVVEKWIEQASALDPVVTH
jgi:predicted flap endonuclease-1-like 5' DNA nuclease